jgi:radical SAM protein with 4Fe4S-binding SPASM domain
LISINFVLMKSNISELPQFIELAHELQVDGVGAYHMVPYQILKNEQESLVHNKELCNRMLNEARAMAKKYGIPFQSPDNFAGHTTTSSNQPMQNIVKRFDLNVTENQPCQCYCPLPFNFIGIEPNGNLLPCGYWYGEKPPGNIFTQPFKEIWNSENYKKLRHELLNNQPRENCRTCPSTGIGKVDNEFSFHPK